jgi:RNA polymerase sigma factor (sigma-70 family)
VLDLRSEEAALVEAVRPAQDPAVDAMVRAELGFVDLVLASMRMARRHDADVLRSAGLEGLLAAARSFDPAREVPFRRWANQRVRGAILDEARRLGFVPRRAAARGERAVFEDVAGVPQACPAPSPEAQAAAREELGAVAARVARLPAAQQHLVIETLAGATLEDAAADLGLSKSWGCRLRAEGLAKVAVNEPPPPLPPRSVPVSRFLEASDHALCDRMWRAYLTSSAAHGHYAGALPAPADEPCDAEEEP